MGLESVQVPCPVCGREIDVPVELTEEHDPENQAVGATLHVRPDMDAALAAHECPGPPSPTPSD